MSHLDFRLQLVEELAKIYGESKHSSQNTTSSDRLTGRHFPSRIQPTQKKKAPTKICVVCSQKFNEKGQRVDDCMEALGLKEHQKNKASQLSVGQRKRMCIAQKIVSNRPSSSSMSPPGWSRTRIFLHGSLIIASRIVLSFIVDNVRLNILQCPILHSRRPSDLDTRICNKLHAIKTQINLWTTLPSRKFDIILNRLNWAHTILPSVSAVGRTSNHLKPL
ncbi:hypothetical protein AVEN_140575-1 [Araneus ventricosus]|uniref:ABC transporter domain-containing protein n=1 Tax=Araneus ventricosus TaxID=182803 RepID=A0A4Y2KYA1_ARAVE|nr:hypothetical protein AVEN_140575-1 [Araneus ventricosus]